MGADPVAIAALVVGLASLLIAALSLAWQIASWALDGRRVHVRLLHGTLAQGGVFTGGVGRDRRRRSLSTLTAQGIVGREVLGIAVTNIGRAPVRVDQYSVELARGGMSFSRVGEVIGPTLPFRLPPGESETWFVELVDASALVSAARSTSPRVSADVRMRVQLGTGDTKRTRRSVIVL